MPEQFLSLYFSRDLHMLRHVHSFVAFILQRER